MRMKVMKFGGTSVGSADRMSDLEARIGDVPLTDV